LWTPANQPDNYIRHRLYGALNIIGQLRKQGNNEPHYIFVEQRIISHIGGQQIVLCMLVAAGDGILRYFRLREIW